MRRHDIRTIVAAIRVQSAARPAPAAPGSLEARMVAIRLGAAVRRTLGLLPADSRCLVQSLVLTRLLSARAISSTVVIGARAEPAFSAHAWVEHEGHPVLPPRGFDESRLVEM
jgi:anti-sigma factor RsiW